MIFSVANHSLRETPHLLPPTLVEKPALFVRLPMRKICFFLNLILSPFLASRHGQKWVEPMVHRLMNFRRGAGSNAKMWDCQHRDQDQGGLLPQCGCLLIRTWTHLTAFATDDGIVADRLINSCHS